MVILARIKKYDNFRFFRIMCHDFSCPVSSFHNSQVSNLGFANYSFKLEHSIIMTKQKMNRTNVGIGFLRKYKKEKEKKKESGSWINKIYNISSASHPYQKKMNRSIVDRT